jgi:hypothetical protein
MYHLHIKSDGAHVRIHTASGSPILKRSFTINPSGGRGTWELRASSGVVIRRFKRATKLRAIERALKEIESAELAVASSQPLPSEPPHQVGHEVGDLPSRLRTVRTVEREFAESLRYLEEERQRSLIRPITEEPTFPCWLYETAYRRWWRCPSFTNRGLMAQLNSHWMPDQPTRPTVIP